MKNILVMGATGVGLFCATVAGLLGAQGRLNYEGTKGIPVLNSFFSPPQEKPGEDKHGKKDDGHDEAAGHGASDELPPPNVTLVEGPSIKESVAADDGHGGGHGGDADHEEKDDAHDENPETPRVPDANSEELRQERERRVFERRMRQLQGKDPRYSEGRLFDMPRIVPTGMTVDEVNRILETARKLQKDLENRGAALDKRSKDITVREQDLADRQNRLVELMQRVDSERQRVEQTIERFNKRVVELNVDEESGFAETARTIGSLKPRAAKELILDYWRTPDGQIKVIKIIAVMEKSKVDEIFALMQTKQLREILDKRANLARTGVKK